MNLLGQTYSGRVYLREGNEQLFLHRAYVTNLTTQQTILTALDGGFSIAAKTGDIIRFTSIITQRQDMRLTAEMLARAGNFVELRPEYHEIQTVNIKFKPTGDLRRDTYALRTAEKKLRIAEIVGLPEPKGDGYSPVQPVAALKDGGLSISVQTIYDALSGDAQKKKRLKDYEIMSRNVTVVRNYFGEDYFKKLKIPQNLVDNFLQFVYLSDNLNRFIDSNNIEATKPFIEKYLPIYLQRLESSHLQDKKG